MDQDIIIEKLILKFKENEYYNLLKGFIYSQDFKDIFQTLGLEVENDKRFTPPLKLVFNAFDKCKYNDLRVIFVGGEPYNEIGIATGMLFDCGDSDRILNPTHYLLKAANSITKIDKRKKVIFNGNLERWASQGVLLLNTPLTTVIDKQGQVHKKIWEAFIAYLFDMLNKDKYIWVFIGKTGSFYSDLITNFHKKIFITNPITGKYNDCDYWDCHNVFSQINTSLTSNNQKPIKW